MRQQDTDEAMTAARFATAMTPDGPFTIITASAVLASGWTEEVGALLPLIHHSLRPPVEALHRGAHGSSAVLDRALRALEDYYLGDLGAPGRVPVIQHSGPFRQEAWEVLRGVPAGTVLTYSEYAARCGRPRAVRAAAGACASNGAALFVPCHRVVRTDGSLGGFRYGLAIKEGLIARESGLAGS